MSIFGVSYSQISGSLGIIPLEHAQLDPSYINSEVEEHKSVLTGHISYVKKRIRSKFKITVFLCNYIGTDVYDKYNEIYAYKDIPFYFYPHIDGNPVYDLYNDPAEFYMTNFEPFYLTQDEYYDALIIEIESTVYNSLLPIAIAPPVGGYGILYGSSYGLGL